MLTDIANNKGDLGVGLYLMTHWNPSLPFVKMERCEQYPEGGWRWHKWGPYIGVQNPQCEYLYDEKNIDVVYTYHIYEIV